MDEYKKPYLILFNTITDALKLLKNSEIAEAERVLLKAQLDAEEAFITACDVQS